ncbi:MAG: beta-ketoacyl-ACP synthase III [candidate division NC10 bacterium]|nr:beta-ketoacyl-ACP synthase III [candidate division NC10 bacterium]
MYQTRIVATGSYVPEKVLTNFDLERMVDTSDEWIRSRTGIAERHVSSESEATSDLATAAGQEALKRAGVKPEEIDLILVATITPDMFFPSTACFVQDKMGAKNAVAFDILAACSGFIYGLSVANSYIRTGAFKQILLIGAETLTKITDWKDRNTCVLFGDGAGAVVLRGEEGEAGLLSTHLYSDGSLWGLLNLPGGGSRNPTTIESVVQGLHFIKMNGNETFKVAVRSLEQACRDALAHNSLDIAQVDLFIPHQANYRIIQAVASRLELPLQKVYLNVERYGNTSAASIPLALDEAVGKGRIKSKDLILLSSFGGGMTWASAVIRW